MGGEAEVEVEVEVDVRTDRVRVSRVRRVVKNIGTSC